MRGVEKERDTGAQIHPQTDTDGQGVWTGRPGPEALLLRLPACVHAGEQRPWPELRAALYLEPEEPVDGPCAKENRLVLEDRKTLPKLRAFQWGREKRVAASELRRVRRPLQEEGGGEGSRVFRNASSPGGWGSGCGRRYLLPSRRMLSQLALGQTWAFEWQVTRAHNHRLWGHEVATPLS